MSRPSPRLSPRIQPPPYEVLRPSYDCDKCGGEFNGSPRYEELDGGWEHLIWGCGVCGYEVSTLTLEQHTKQTMKVRYA